VSKLKGRVAELNSGSTEEVAKACEEIKDGIEGVKEDCTELPMGNALGKEGKLPSKVEGKLGTASEGNKGLEARPKLVNPKSDGFTSSLTGL